MYSVGIYCPVKNEKYLIEWIKYHILIGISHFILFDDFSDIPIEYTIQESKLDLTMFTIIKQTYKFRHNTTDFFKNNVFDHLKRKNIEYLLQIDADEFLYINKHKTIQNFINYHNPFDCIKINWLFFGSDLLKKNETNSVIEIFNKSNNKTNNHVKSLTKTCSIDLLKNVVCSHFVPIIDNGIIKNHIGNKTTLSAFDDAYEINEDSVYIAHYACQDLYTYVYRKFVLYDEKLNFYYWNLVKSNNKINVKLYHNVVSNNLTEFVDFLYELKNNGGILKNDKFSIIPNEYIKFIAEYYTSLNGNVIINNDIINICKNIVN